MRLSRPSVLIALLCCCAAPPLRADAQEPPSPSVDEQIGTCVRIEDSDPGRALAIAENLLATGGSLSPQQLAAATACRGWARINTGQREAAFVDAHAVRSVLQPLSASAERVRLLRRAGGILHRGGDRVGAIDFYARAEADTEALGLDAERIPLLVNLGVLHSEFEQHQRARVNYEQALMLMTRLDDFRHEAAVRFNLGLNYAGQRRHDEAATQIRRALDLLSADPTSHPGQRILVEMALAQALLSSGDEAGARVITNELRRRDASLLDQAAKTQLAILEAEQLAAGDQTHAALSVIDGLLAPNAHTLSDIQRWHLLKARSTLLERLGHFQEAATTLREVNAVREAHMRHLNHEHLAALDAHMRDREQRHELERLHAQSLLQAQELRGDRRLQATGVAIVFI